MVRKLFGFGQIPQHHAARCNAFCGEPVNPFLNFHRSCRFATDRLDPGKPGRIKRIYRPRCIARIDLMTCVCRRKTGWRN